VGGFVLKITFSRMDEEAAREILSWRYDEPYTMYHLQDETAGKEVMDYLLSPDNLFYRMDGAEGRLIAFCSFGEDARVNGGDYSSPALDIGLGMKPELTGHGMGRFVIAEVLKFSAEQFYFPDYRVTIAAFNQRAQKAWQANGFVQSQTFLRPFDQFPFVILICEANKVLPINDSVDPEGE
jgi:ribosomal-protein-alanine N-acetyltransferase